MSGSRSGSGISLSGCVDQLADCGHGSTKGLNLNCPYCGLLAQEVRQEAELIVNQVASVVARHQVRIRER